VTKLTNGMLLDAKIIMDNYLPDLRQDLHKLIPPVLQMHLDSVLLNFEYRLASCDVASKYEEIHWD